MTKPYRTILIDDPQLFNDGMRLILNNSPDFVVVE
jgi:DNA-binding NarL/FixJ family response regulator